MPIVDMSAVPACRRSGSHLGCLLVAVATVWHCDRVLELPVLFCGPQSAAGISAGAARCAQHRAFHRE